jgi:hypothetical protein
MWMTEFADTKGFCGTQILNPGVVSNLTYREEFLDVYNQYERKLYDVLA